MATTDEILKAAQDLGKLIAKHAATKQFDDMVKQLRDDVEAALDHLARRNAQRRRLRGQPRNQRDLKRQQTPKHDRP